ncbi:hypothetical protein ACJX0J_006032, partial [Zea mays]
EEMINASMLLLLLDEFCNQILEFSTCMLNFETKMHAAIQITMFFMPNPAGAQDLRCSARRQNLFNSEKPSSFRVDKLPVVTQHAGEFFLAFWNWIVL